MVDDKVWKLHRNDNEKAFNVTVEQTLTRVKADKLELYELNADPAEKHKIDITSNPIATKLADELNDAIKEGDTGQGTRARMVKVK